MDYNVSASAIAEAIDFMKTNFIAPLDSNTTDIVNQYRQIASADVLSSAIIDGILAGIESKIKKLQSDFDTIERDIRQKMGVSQETIESQDTSMQSQLNNY